jgi:hypothetical protein
MSDRMDMGAGPRGRHDVAMTSAVSKILLVAEPSPTGQTGPSPVRKRYRLARLRLETQRPAGEARFAHLRRTYD